MTSPRPPWALYSGSSENPLFYVIADFAPKKSPDVASKYSDTNSEALLLRGCAWRTANQGIIRTRRKSPVLLSLASAPVIATPTPAQTFWRKKFPPNL